MSNVIVKLERAGKIQIVVMREDDYTSSVKFDRGNNAKLKYGPGAMWYIKDVQCQPDEVEY